VDDVLTGLLRPKGVAVVGASETPGKIGHTVVKNLIEGGYEGRIYPINPSSDEILGLKVYKSVFRHSREYRCSCDNRPGKICSGCCQGMR